MEAQRMRKLWSFGKAFACDRIDEGNPNLRLA